MSHEQTSEDFPRSRAEIDFMYQTLVTHSPDAIVLHHNDKFLYANPAAVKLFGAKNEIDLLKHSLMDFISKGDQQTVVDIVDKLQNKDILMHPLSLQLANLQGTHIDVEVTATSVVRNGKKIVQGMIRDVTHQKWIREIQNINHEWTIFRQLIQHLADKTLNPLTVIEGFLTLLKEGDDKVSIDLLLQEVDSIHQTWQRLISFSQDRMPNPDISFQNLFSED